MPVIAAAVSANAKILILKLITTLCAVHTDWAIAVSANAKILILKLITTMSKAEREGAKLCLLMQRY